MWLNGLCFVQLLKHWGNWKTMQGQRGSKPRPKTENRSQTLRAREQLLRRAVISIPVS